MDKKLDLILLLVKEGKITNEEAKLLLEKEKEYIYTPSYPYYHYYPWWAGTTATPYINCGTTTSGDSTNITFTTTSN